MTMAALIHTQNLELGIPDKIRDSCEAYLVVALESRTADRLDEDVEKTGELLAELGAVDAYVLEGASARKLIEAREKAFWTVKAVGADDLIDTVVPRGAMPKFISAARGLTTAAGGVAVGCGHAGDGNVHLAILCKDSEKRHQLMTDILALAMELGGAISGEHGLGRAKTPYFLELEDPAKVALMRRIKKSFDPAGILNPDVVLAAESLT
jgi:glycolate oxidase